MSTSEQQAADCYICRKHRGEISIPGGAIYEDDLLYAGHIKMNEEQSTYLGYLMIETKRHTPGLAELNEAEAQAIGLLANRLSRALKASEAAEHVYAFVIGDHIPHFHMHIVPRYPGAPREYWGVHVDEWPDAPHGGDSEITALCARLRNQLENER